MISCCSQWSISRINLPDWNLCTCSRLLISRLKHACFFQDSSQCVRQCLECRLLSHLAHTAYIMHTLYIHCTYIVHTTYFLCMSMNSWNGRVTKEHTCTRHYQLYPKEHCIVHERGSPRIHMYLERWILCRFEHKVSQCSSSLWRKRWLIILGSIHF
jgi:hypothetical protein